MYLRDIGESVLSSRSSLCNIIVDVGVRGYVNSSIWCNLAETEPSRVLRGGVVTRGTLNHNTQTLLVVNATVRNMT